MSEYVLVSQGIECARFDEPYEAITEAIKSNKEYFEYLQRCAEEYECPADNEMFVYKEDRGKAIELDLFMCKQIINKARAKVIEEITKGIEFEEKWLSDAIREDKGNYEYNIDIAFSGIKNSLQNLKEQK